MSAAAPRGRPARVTVTLKDARQATHACSSHRGDFMQPFERPELLAKFRELSAHVLTHEGVQRLEKILEGFETIDDVRSALEGLAPHARLREP